MLRRQSIILLAFVTLPVINAHAQEPESTSGIAATSDVFRDDGFKFLVYGGSLLADNEPQLKGLGNRYSLGLGFSADFARPRFAGFDLELQSLHREFDTPVAAPYWGTIDNKTHIETLSLRFGARLFYPDNGPLRAYASGGLGYTKTTMRVSGTLLGVPGSYEESDTSWTPYIGAGIRYRFDTWSLGFDYRHTELKGDFPDFGVTNANIGGDSYMLGIGWRIK